MTTCGECSSFPCDNSGAHLKDDKACSDFKPLSFTRTVEDSNGGCIGTVCFEKDGDDVNCRIQYPLKGEGFRESDPIRFHKLTEEIKEQILSVIYNHCEVVNRGYVGADLEETFKELVGLHWYPKTWKATARPNQATENTQEAQTQADEADIPEEARKAAYNEAMEILKHGDPVRYLQDTISTIHIGDTDAVEGLILAIANQSCTNTQGLQIKMSGSSGTGKTHLGKSVLQCVRKKHVHESTLSSKAAYYLNMKPGTILFCDDTEISEEMEEVIKRATSNYQDYTTHTTVKDQNVKTLQIPSRILWLLTSVDDNVSDQLLNRQLMFSTDETNEQKGRIFEMQKKEAIEGVLHNQCITHNVLVCREVMDHIKKTLFAVRIPFADKLKLADLSNTRNFPMFLDAIKGYTILMQEQRGKDDEGFLLATKDDYLRAKRLIEAQSESLRTKLNSKERRILAAISHDSLGLDINQIAGKTGYVYQQVRDTLEGRLKRGGMLAKVPGLQREELIENEKDEAGSTGRKRIVYSYKNKGNALLIYDSAFIELEE